MKKCVIIPDSFKGTMSSEEVCEIESSMLTEAFKDCQIISLPIADGGEGTVNCFLHAMNGEKITVKVKDAFGDEIESFYGRFGDFAVIEMAAASGMVTNARHNPMIASTYGVGQLINHAISSGCRRILIGLGGSCTNDAGAGMAAAIGTIFYNADGEAFVPAGGTLNEIARIDNSILKQKLKDIQISCMCDIDNILYGPEGAAYIFAPQKGADEHQVKLLDENLRYFAEIVLKEMNIDISGICGGGAAGGMGAGAFAFLGADLKKGIDYILDIIGFDDILDGCDLVITGEGRLDMQSLRGKVIYGVSRRTMKKSVPLLAVVGCISEGMDSEEGIKQLQSIGIKKVYATSDGKDSLESIKKSCRKNLADTMNCVISDLKNC